MDNYYISYCNLDHRTDRLNHMIDQLNKIGLPAIRQRSFPWKELDYNNPKYATMVNRTPGALGCHFSQVEVMKKALEQNKNAMVLEDDIEFCSDFFDRLKIIEEFCDGNEWDIIWLGAAFHVNPPHWHRVGESTMRPNCSAQLGYDAKRTDNPRIIRTFGAYNTFAYIVNKNSIQKILNLFDRHIHTSIGIDFLFIQLQPQLNCFSFVPGCVKQKDNMSDIGNGMTMWSGHLRNGPYVFQDKMEMFEPDSYDWHEAK